MDCRLPDCLLSIVVPAIDRHCQNCRNARSLHGLINSINKPVDGPANEAMAQSPMLRVRRGEMLVLPFDTAAEDFRAADHFSASWSRAGTKGTGVISPN